MWYVNYISVKLLPKKKKKSTDRDPILNVSSAFTSAKNCPRKPLQQRRHAGSTERDQVRAHRTRGRSAVQRKPDLRRAGHGLFSQPQRLGAVTSSSVGRSWKWIQNPNVAYHYSTLISWMKCISLTHRTG